MESGKDGRDINSTSVNYPDGKVYLAHKAKNNR